MTLGTAAGSMVHRFKDLRMHPFFADLQRRQGDLRRAVLGHREPAPAPTFELAPLMLAIRENRAPRGFAGEITEEARKLQPENPVLGGCCVLPFEVLALRDLNTAAPTAGGSLVQATTMEAVTPFGGAIARQVGVVVEGGHTGNPIIPVTASPPAVSWLTAESTGPGDQTPPTGQASSSPKVATANIRISERLLRAGGPTVERYLRAVLNQAAEAALDAAVFSGTGSGGQPLGLLANPAIPTVSGTSLGLAGLNDALKSVSDNVVSDAGARWVGATGVRKLLQERVAFASTASPLWTDADTVRGRPAVVSRAMAAGTMVYGLMSEARAHLWGVGIELAADPYTDFRSLLTTWRVMLTVDVVAPRPQALVRISSIT